MLIAMAGIAATLGLFLVFLLGSLTAWRNVALICFIVPVATLVAICFVCDKSQIQAINMSIITAMFDFVSRFPRLRCGFYRKIVRPMRCNRFNGFAAGSRPKPLRSNSKVCSAITKYQIHVRNVSKTMPNAPIHRQRPNKSFKNCCANGI